MKKFLIDTFVFIFAVFAFVCFFVFLQTHYIWGNIDIEQILINLNEGIDLVSDHLLIGYIISIILGIVTAVATSVFLKKNWRLFTVSVVLCFVVLWQIGLFSYFLNKHLYSDIYEREYTNPQNLHFTFPNPKRNIIVAYIESGEVNYATDLKQNLIEKTYAFMNNSLSFSGFHQILYQDYTLAAMLSSMCAIPYRGSNLKGYEGYQNFLANLVCYPQILQENGYETVFMKGANINFSRTGLFMTTHGFNEALGAQELNQKFDLPLKDNTGGFNGYHDAALYRMVKDTLTRLSQKEKPFLLSFITLDTHSPDFFLSPGCKGTSSHQQDVVRCADSMLADFISWLKEQPFYPNTTLVVLGDHPQTGINRIYPKLRQRQIINFILNPSPAFSKATHSSWTTLDVAPTILNAAGISFNGAKFGLGRSLFQTEPTLYEKFGHKLETELLKSSHVYNSFEKIKNKKIPQYNFYESLGDDIKTPDAVSSYATYANPLQGAVFLEELSFKLPQTTSDLAFDITFKTLLTKKRERTVKVFANGTLVDTWHVSFSDKQPVSKRALIPARLINDDKLLIFFDADEVASLSEALGIGVLRFSLNPVTQK